ncbi:type II secretion system F family protein [Streptoalloteichus hindustanus]|uniref:Type II secretion system (T2SS), protein F n=1 Tax=Streptoalloteichus hindustanus TaxID=2017 RepID=A0A1M4VWM7_STRHI|nr:type II secretion system F family protein [Streptoalloteichus hindustanus]SHE73132.1 Type II secretion system (T2SS), protein F [Streptoalloteichus hindustanus]
MTAQSAAVATLAAALLAAPGPAVARTRLVALRPDHPSTAPRQLNWLPMSLVGTFGLLVAGLVPGVLGTLLGLTIPVAVLLGWRHRAQRRAVAAVADPARLAAGWDLLAASLTAGLPVPAAVRACLTGLPAAPAAVLRRVAELLALGADPVAAWAPALDHPDTAQLARAARRTARSGSALADVARLLAAELRAEAKDSAESHAQRAGVLITGPLGLCFLPAFLCLGVVPVVLGLARRLAESW